ncbi:MAG: PspC domain-containing protein [Prevotellaceae bacterium]|jgi:phage shock protein PspC (stress-responsive transcriptional regulator)|nr:PspC domain-containing protein [Prevotellaceae bacterium]
MKKAISISIGKTSFIMEEDAFDRLKGYLDKFEASIDNKSDVKEVMEDVEARIAEIFAEQIRSSNQVVDINLVNKAISLLGEPEVDTRTANGGNTSRAVPPPPAQPYAHKRFYRDPDNSVIGGVCAGVAAYFKLDILLVRILFACAIPLGGLGLWVYIVLWIAAPMAKTVAEKLEMRGEPVTAENIRNYSAKYK